MSGRVVIADMNRDGRPDVVANMPDAGVIGVYRNTGDGSLAAPLLVATERNARDLAVADMNGDGRPDIVVAEATTVVNVEYALADGGYAESSACGFQVAPDAVVVADFNRDGLPDIAVAIRAETAIHLCLQQPGGTFASPTDVPLGAASFTLAAADMNGDGIPDLVITDSQDVNILDGYGDGSFAPATSHATCVGPVQLAIGDVDRDGHPDVLVRCGTGEIDFVRGGVAGDGTSVATGAGTGLALGDLDRNGTLDIVDGSAFAPQLAVHLGGGDGTFGTAQGGTGAADGGLAAAIALADMNGDGRLDAVVTYPGTQELAVLLANSAGTGTGLLSVDESASINVVGGDGQAAVCDLNGDGLLDAVTANPYDSTISVLRGEADGGLSGPTRTQAIGYASALAIGDLDRDGRPDMVTGSFTDGGLQVLYNQPDGGFRDGGRYLAGQRITGVAVGDINRDGWLDLVAIEADDQGGSVEVLDWNPAQSEFVAQPALEVGPSPLTPISVAVGDVDRDGWPDVVVGSDPGPPRVYLGLHDGGLGAATVLGGPDALTSLVLVDLDGDGKLDIVGTDSAELFTHVLRGQGDGSFGPPAVYPEVGIPMAVAITDVDGDGRPDAVIGMFSDASGGRPNLVVRFNLGDGGLGPALDTGFTRDLTEVAAGDLNRDGRTDVFIVDGNPDLAWVATNVCR